VLSIGKLGAGASAADYCGNTGTVCRAVSAGYAAQVLTWASRYGQVTTAAGLTAAVAVKAALSQLDTPYLWGGDSPAGFDCSGLVQWAYARAGVALPRVAQDQYDAGPTLARAAALVPGDLLFFGTGPRSVTHVGIYLGDGRFVDAPHTGAVVRVDILAGFTPRLVGATRPAQVTA
jgi:cell wall-associated NlpC family hydrolase